MDENEITQRLRDAGDQPVPGEVRASHLSQMHAASPTVEQPKRFGRLAVAAAAFVGFAVGSTGFAMAGALPAPAQQVAHDVLDVVNLNVENPRENRGQCISDAAKANPDDEAAKQAAKDLCPRGGPPEGVGNGRPDHAGVPGGPNGVPHADDPCKGPPPWAGRDGETYTAEQKAAYRQGCVDDEGGDAAELEADALEDQQEQEAEARGAEQGDGQPPTEPQGDAPTETPADPPVAEPPADAPPVQPDEPVTPPVETPAPSGDAETETDPDEG